MERGRLLPEEWGDAIAAWTGWLTLRGISEKTIRLRRQHLQMVARRSETLAPRELTRPLLESVFAGQRWSAEYRKSMRSSLVTFYEWAIASGVAADNVADCLPKVKTPPPNPRPAPDHVWAQLLAHAPMREAMMAKLACHVGMRRDEVCRAHRDDLIEDLGGHSLIVHGKGGKQRVVPLDADTAAQIMDFCDGGFLFPGRIDGHISAHHVGKIISALMPPGWTMHKLRHRYATRGYAGTGNLRAVQEALGHASVATTQRYTAVSTREVRAVSEAAGGKLLLFPAAVPETGA